MPRNVHVVLAVSALFLASNVLFAKSLAPFAAAVLFGGCAGSFALLALGASRTGILGEPAQWRLLGVLIGAAFVLLLIGGEGHVFFSKDDWLYRDAVLSDLVDGGFPVVYREQGQDLLLRAPLGMYLLPAAVGRAVSLHAAHLALLIQNALVLGGFFYVVALLWPRPLAMAALFTAFGCLDAIPFLVKTGGAWLAVNLSFWSEYWNYSNHVAQLFWNPNHVLPAWWFVALGLLLLRRELDFTAFAAGVLPLALWSPISLMGAAAPAATFLFVAQRTGAWGRWPLLCLAAPAFLPVLVYLALAAESVEHEWLTSKADFFDQYLIFNIFALAQGAFVAAQWRRVDPWFRGAVLASLVELLIFPLYSIGSMNDFSQRASLIPRAYVALAFGALLLRSLRERRPAAAAVGSTLALIAAVSPALEIYDSLRTPRFSIGDCNLLTVHRKVHPHASLATYLAPVGAAPRWLLGGVEAARPKESVDRVCWPDRVYGEKLFNWLDPKYRIWLRRGAAETAPTSVVR